MHFSYSTPSKFEISVLPRNQCFNVKYTEYENGKRDTLYEASYDTSSPFGGILGRFRNYSIITPVPVIISSYVRTWLFIRYFVCHQIIFVWGEDIDRLHTWVEDNTPPDPRSSKTVFCKWTHKPHPIHYRLQPTGNKISSITRVQYHVHSLHLRRRKKVFHNTLDSGDKKTNPPPRFTKLK